MLDWQLCQICYPLEIKLLLLLLLLQRYDNFKPFKTFGANRGGLWAWAKIVALPNRNLSHS